MIVIGLTGSIGMGKSAVSAMFRQLHVPVFDADAVVHELQGPQGALLQSIEAQFPDTTGTQGVDRQKLSAAVLDKPEALAVLERIVHPAVAKRRETFLKRHRARHMVVLDIPLLLEKKSWQQVDLVLVVSAPAWIQRRRVLARHNMTPAKFRAILKVQIADHIKRRVADIVIETARPRNATRAAIRQLVACIKAKRTR